MRSLQDAAIILVKVHTSGIGVLRCLSVCYTPSPDAARRISGSQHCFDLRPVCPSVCDGEQNNTRENWFIFFAKLHLGPCAMFFFDKMSFERF